MPGIFISYRREDSPGHAGRIFDRLRSRFGSGVVFMDVTAIDAGVDFVDVLQKAVGSCDALLAVIGPQWLSATHDGKPRLDDPHDFVRIEIAGALQRNVRVLPVLVDGASLPQTSALPADLQALTRRQAIELRDARWDDDIERLVEGLEKFLKVGGEVPATTPAATVADRSSAKSPIGRGIAIGAAAALILVIAAVFAWRGGLGSGNRSTLASNPGAGPNTGTVSGTTDGSANTKPAPPTPTDAPTPSSATAKPAMPDVTGRAVPEAREILRKAGFRLAVIFSADMTKAPGIVVSQTLGEGTRLVMLTAVATSTVVVHVAKGDERNAEALADYLRSQSSTTGSIVRSQPVAPRAELVGRVAYSEERLAAQAQEIAKDVNQYLARADPGRTVHATMNPRVTRRNIIVGLYDRAQ